MFWSRKLMVHHGYPIVDSEYRIEFRDTLNEPWRGVIVFEPHNGAEQVAFNEEKQSLEFAEILSSHHRYVRVIHVLSDEIVEEYKNNKPVGEIHTGIPWVKQKQSMVAKN